ncbi:GD16522 [Drosophila simulans]|uniref:GD16522 n=1 Tax=Drosophila simulans TaxID=7240 RepID=B4R7H0_DROSI|nr:GD16522 [Drosophila simulans]
MKLTTTSQYINFSACVVMAMKPVFLPRNRNERRSRKGSGWLGEQDQGPGGGSR